MPLEERVRTLTSETAEFLGIGDQGVLRPGAFADVIVIDFDGLRVRPPGLVRDRDHPTGASAPGMRHSRRLKPMSRTRGSCRALLKAADRNGVSN